jgi:hypothetical protein
MNKINTIQYNTNTIHIVRDGVVIILVGTQTVDSDTDETAGTSTEVLAK